MELFLGEFVSTAADIVNLGDKNGFRNFTFGAFVN